MRRIRRVVLVAVGSVLLLTAALCSGAEDVSLPKPTAIETLFAQAIKHGGYEKACAARPGGCPMPDVALTHFPDDGIRGMFTFTHPTFISVSYDHDAPGTLDWNETLVHEFVHYLQWLHGKYTPASNDICSMMYEVEAEAYKAGHAYLAQFGIARDTEDTLASLRFERAMCRAAQYGGY